MCNINLAFRRDRKNSNRIKEFMNIASYVSYERNSDGDGFFGFYGKDNIICDKSKEKIKIDKNIWFVCSHQRLSTSGHNEKNVHPFETKDFILVHNGVFTGLGDKDKSDTSYFVDKLSNNYNGDMVKAIQATTKEVSGSYSVVVYDKNTDKVYYFKESSTSMYYIQDKNYLFMSTIRDNVDLALYMFDIDSQYIYQVLENKIYDVLDGFKEVGVFEEKESEWYSYGNYYPKSNGSSRSDTGYYHNEKVEENVCEDRRKRIPNEFDYMVDKTGEVFIYPVREERYPEGDWRNEDDSIFEDDAGRPMWL